MASASTTFRCEALACHCRPKTSVSLENEFWNSLKEIASERGMTLAELVAAIAGERQHANLPSAIRVFVLGFYRDQSEFDKALKQD